MGIGLLVPAIALYGQATGTCEHTFEANFQLGGALRMHLRSGDIEVAGSDSPAVRVSCKLDRPELAKDVTITFRAGEKTADLRLRGGPNNGIRFRIEIPKDTDLFIRSPAGDLTISGVSGDKDIEIHAGDLTISVGDAASYRHADASVYAGDLNAAAFGVNKDGLFRSFSKENPAGKYRLHAHIAAGDLVLK